VPYAIPDDQVNLSGIEPNYGAYTSDYVPEYPQLLLTKASIETRKQNTRGFLGMFCDMTLEQQVEVLTSGIRMQEVGFDMGAPQPQHTPRYLLDINPARKFMATTAVTTDAFRKGMSQFKLQRQTMAPLIADQEWCEQFVIGTALTPYGWYSNDLKPPRVGPNTFTSAHQHYVAFKAAGVPQPQIAAYAKWHIGHHGYNSDNVISLVHSGTAALFEQTYGTISETAYYAVIPFIQDLIQYGFRPGMPMSGVPTLISDWVPMGYQLFIALGEEKPMVWKVLRDPASVDAYMDQDVPIPNSQYHWWSTLTRYGAPTIQSPGQGVAVQLTAANDGDAYATPSGMLDIGT
jgi:hypothetical protein